jgi:tetratricopeptide (TPR) repeat protein
MQELIQHLCQTIAVQLQAQPQISTADLVTAVLARITGDERLQQEIESQSGTIQINTGNATGYQTIVNGGVAYIGQNYHIDKDVARSAIESLLKQLGLISISIPNNINRIGSKHFGGRDNELLELDRLFRSSQQVAITAVQGMGGVGKTELALQYALKQLRAKTYPGGVCWLRGRDDVGGQIEIFAQTCLGLGLPEELKNKSTADQVAYYWQHWQEGKVLVIVDDVLDYGAVRDYLPPADGRFQVLLTTRLELRSGIERLHLDVLNPEDALKLLRKLIESERIDQQLVDAAVLCEWLGCLPLGIEFVGRHLARNRTLTLAQMRERLNAKRLAARGLIKSTLDVEMTATHESLAAAFEVSWEDLGNNAVFTPPIGDYARQLGALLSVFAAAPIVWQWVVDCFTDWDEEDLEAARDEGLVGSHLLQANEDNTYQLHPMVRQFFGVKCNGMSVKGEFEQSFQTIILAEAERSIKKPEKSLIVECSLVIPHLQAFINQREDENLTAETLEILSGLSWLAGLYREMGRYNDAEPLCIRSLIISERQLGADHPDTIASLNNLAELYREMGRYIDAEPLYIRSLTISEQQLVADHPITAISLNNLANFYQATGRYNDAELFYLRSLAISEQQLGTDHPEIATCLNNLGELYRQMGRYIDAEPLHIRALDIKEEKLGIDHPDTATSLNNLGLLYESMDRYKDAEPLHMRALNSREQQLGADHPDITQSLNNLANLYRATGRYKQAEPLYVRALDISERQLGADHPITAISLNNLANLYQELGKYGEAEVLHARALAISERQLGANHPDTAISLNNLADLYQSMGRYLDAEPLYIRALDILEQQFGADHPITAISMSSLANLYRAMGRYSEAESLYIRLLDTLERQLGADHPNIQIMRKNLESLRSRLNTE